MRAAHREYGVSVPSRPASFARFGHRAGWPSYSHRPASVDELETPSPAGSALSRENRDPLAKPARGSASRRLEWRTARASSAGAALTSHFPTSDIPRRPRGHRPAVSMNHPEACEMHALRRTPRFWTRAT